MENPKQWNITIRKLISELTGVDISLIYKQGQTFAPITPDEFISYSLSRIETAATPYKIGEDFRTAAELTYVITIYGPDASLTALTLINKLQQQTAKDILQPEQLGLKSAYIINNITEYINNKGYNRTDIELLLSAEIKDTVPGTINKVNFSVDIAG